MNFSVDEYESVGEHAAYWNTVLADEAERTTISSPRVMTIVPSSPIHIATLPPVMIPSADTIRSMPIDGFIAMLKSLANATTRVKEVEEPIDYHQEPEVEDDKDLGLPYFPNNPASLRFYPLLIPHTDDTDERVVAPYIYYCNKNQEVVGCMKRGSAPYSGPVYMHTPNPIHLLLPLTHTQIQQFSTEDPRAYAINEVLRQPEDPCIDVEVSQLRDKLDLQKKIQKQLDDVWKEERQLVGAQFDVEQTITGIQDCMERACLYQTLVDTYAHMVVQPTHSPSDHPLNLRPHGPLEMPQLHDEPRCRGCWECRSHTHCHKQCPQCHCPQRPCTYCQSQSHRSPQCLFKRLTIPPPPSCTVEEALNQTPVAPKWCSKCLCNNLRHKGVDCPTRELCCACSRRGNLFFLHTHKCDNTSDQLMHGKNNEVADPDLYGDGKS